MSIVSTEIKTAIGGVPSLYLWLGGAVLAGSLLIGARVYWDHSVTKAADKVIAAYVAQKTKDDAALSAVEVKTNTKIVVQYQDRVKTIVQQGKTNVQTIIQYVPDREYLSKQWVQDHDISAAGGSIDATKPVDATASEFTASEALATVADNYSTCQQYKARVDAWEAWLAQTNADIVAENKKAKR